MSSAFPDPPPYWSTFTKPNLKEFRDRQHSSPSEPLPSHLQHLTPPEPPLDLKYRSFGIHHDLLAPTPSLADTSIPILLPSSSPSSPSLVPTLLTLSRSLLLNYLELVTLLSTSPNTSLEKVNDLQTILYNIHDVINTYRPHQAREALIEMMQGEIKRVEREVESVERVKGELNVVLATMAGRVEEMEKETVVQEKNGVRRGKEREEMLWERLEMEMGG